MGTRDGMDDTDDELTFEQIKYYLSEWGFARELNATEQELNLIDIDVDDLQAKEMIVNSVLAKVMPKEYLPFRTELTVAIIYKQVRNICDLHTFCSEHS